MKKIVWPLAALALLAAIGFKVAADMPQKPTYFGRPTPTLATSPADAAANGVCRGGLTVAMFSPEMGITQADVDGYTERMATEGKTCDEVAYLGPVQNADGSTDYIYRIVISGKQLWYVFTVGSDGLVENIQ